MTQVTMVPQRMATASDDQVLRHGATLEEEQAGWSASYDAATLADDPTRRNHCAMALGRLALELKAVQAELERRTA